MPNLLRVRHLQHLLRQRRQLNVFMPLPRWDEVVNIPVLCHPCSLLFKYKYSLLLAPLLHRHDLFSTRYVPLWSPTCACTSGAAIEWPGNDSWKTVGFSPADHLLETRSCSAPPELEYHHCSTSVCLFFFTDCMLSPSDTVGFLETSYDATYEATSRSCASTLVKYSLEGVPLGLSPFSRHRSVKKHLAASLTSSRTSSSRADAGPRVCPFCRGVAVPSQDLILLCFHRKQKRGQKKGGGVTATVNNPPPASRHYKQIVPPPPHYWFSKNS